MIASVPVSFSWPMANFAQTLRDLRSARKLTQTRIAELLQVSPRVYSRWETGDVTPHFDTIVRIAELLVEKQPEPPFGISPQVADQRAADLLHVVCADTHRELRF